MTAYCVVQYKLLGLYNPEADIELMLKELGEPVKKAMIRMDEKSLKSLEKIIKRTEERILFFQKQNPGVTESEEAQRIIKTLREIKKECEELND